MSMTFRPSQPQSGLNKQIDAFLLDDEPTSHQPPADTADPITDTDTDTDALSPLPLKPVRAATSENLTSTQDTPPVQSPDLSRSHSARGARLSSSFFPALAKARLALSSSSSSSSSSPADREMRSSRARDPPPKPRPLLALKLSGSSFLDTIIRDDKTKDPLYILETTRELTAVYRLDHPRDEPVKAATVQWPLHPVRIKGKSGRTVQFGNGSWRESEDLLKTGPLGSNAIRKFSIPHYPNSLKWKLIPGNCFCCVTNAVKGPVAVLDAATLSAPPRLKVYHPLIERDVARSQDNYKGIPTILLDYLVVTSLLLVTDVQEWLDRPREARIPGSSSYTVQRWLALIHNTPAPPEPDHPTVDLSLTVPSTPPHSATFPSPGGFWETQSGVTSLSGSGSNGSGSGASYLGEPFTPTTPATSGTSATSANSSTFFSRSTEDAPPVPPVPGSSFVAHNAEARRSPFDLPKAGLQTSVHSAHSSTSTTNNAASRPYTQSGEGDKELASSRSGPGTSLSGGGAAALSTSAPTSPYPISASSSTSSSARPSRRQLPVPPGPVPANSFAQPWLYSSNSPASASSSASTMTPTSATSPSTPQSASANPSPAARAARASMRGSLRTFPIPPPPPPPQHSIPLPPKLAHEHGAYSASIGARPRTAPQRDGSNRRRHSESFSAGQFGEPSPVDDSSPVGHPYAAASSSSFSRRGRDTNVHDLTGQMGGLSTSPGPSSLTAADARGHARAPSQPAPDYDTHSFVNMPPPLPIPPASSSGTGSRPPARRQLTVVNADMSAADGEAPASTRPNGSTHTSMSAGHISACPPSPSDLRLNPRISYADSVYEMPPPAYDAIDFSVQFVPPVPPIPAHLSAAAGPLPVPPSEVGAEGQRSS